MSKSILVIGGGAAGFYAAIHCKLFDPEAEVKIVEKSQKTLAKVKISGGGRCNVAHDENDAQKLARYYPRGERFLAKAFREYGVKETRQFFEDRGVPLVVQEDGCIFPKSQNSQSIIDCFENECRRLNIEILKGFAMQELRKEASGQWTVCSKTESLTADKIILALGGLIKWEQMAWLQDMGQDMVPPFPSLFTFNMPNEKITELMGIVAPNALTRIPGSKHQGFGPLLITHWGMSGPAVLMLSAKAARELGACSYRFLTNVSWLGTFNEQEIGELLQDWMLRHPKKQIGGTSFEGLSNRLWVYLLTKSGIALDKIWSALNKKEINKLIVTLTQDTYHVEGKTTFKEEFVTAGGVDLNKVNFKTMESKVLPGLYFAGEMLDIDGLTGGFNFQASWTTGWLAARGAVG
jgi:predicted Rossmann fold flavoprotein